MAGVKGSWRYEGEMKKRMDDEKMALRAIDEALDNDPSFDDIDSILDVLDYLDPPEDF